MQPAEQRWTLMRFEEEFEVWEQCDDISPDLGLATWNWIMSRAENPYRSVIRSRETDNLWFGAIPRAGLPPGKIAVCSYFVEESRKLVRCNSFAILNVPVR